MKRTILSLSVALIMSMALTGCGGGGSSGSGSGGQTIQPPSDAPPQPAPGSNLPPPSERKQ